MKNIRRQTKLWTTKSGNRIRICDMDNSHLDNTIKLLNRVAEIETTKAINEGESLLCCLQGEMAVYSVESEIDRLMQCGLDPSEINPLYDNLILERNRRSAKGGD